MSAPRNHSGAGTPGRGTTDRGPREPASERLAEVEELEGRVEKLVAGGDGLVRFEGIPIFVPRSAPGDLLRLRLVERRASFARAEIVEILEPGTGRRTPPCPYFERCGGCDLQHLDDAMQLRLKAEAVGENLRRLGGLEMPSDVTVVAGKPWGYRLRAQLHVAAGEGGTEVGFFARRSHDLVAVDRCPILVPELEEQLSDLGRRVHGTPHHRLDVAAGDGGRWACTPPISGLPRGELHLEVGEFTYLYTASCFFQAHRQLLPQLVEQALGPAADGDDDGEAYDLFAGVGFLSLPLSRRYRRVVAVEGDRVAARLAKKNARQNGIANLTIQTQAVESWIQTLPQGAARVVVDPPRVGLSARMRQRLLERRPRRLTYVSCDSATLARDLKILLRPSTAAGRRRGYRIESLALLDMFPQTGHLEAVVQLVDRVAGPREAGPREAGPREAGPREAAAAKS